MFKRIYFVVQGLHEKSDSIGFDCVFQFQTVLQNLGAKAEVRLFAQNYAAERYPGILIEPIESLYAQIANLEDTIIIYHFCDGWAEFKRHILGFRGKLVVRWHNNTPPWFFTKYSLTSVERSIRGFREIIGFGNLMSADFWCNSEFSVQQLHSLGVNTQRARVVYPASIYLDKNIDVKSSDQRPLRADKPSILFVSRVTAHKGHINVLFTAAYLKEILKSPVLVDFPGRPDRSGPGYLSELRNLANRLGIDMNLAGEVSNEALNRMYENASVYCCLSEHEGFGLPVYEAMRKGVPVVGWANTALAEPLQNHPLCNSELDLKYFAAATAAALDPAVRHYVINWQRDNVLCDYTSEKLKSQMFEGLSISQDRRSAAKRDINSLESMEMLISNTVRKYRQALISSEFDLLELDRPVEIRNNFVTRYDVESYQVLLQLGGSIEYPENGKILMPPDRFSYSQRDVMRVSAKEVCCSLQNSSNPLIWGPFIRISPGRYTVLFDISWMVEELRNDASFVFEVVANEAVISRYKVAAEARSYSGKIAVVFSYRRSSGPLEFRISTSKGLSGELIFRGAEISEKLLIVKVVSRSARKMVQNLENGTLAIWKHPFSASKRKKFRKQRRSAG